MSDVLVKDIQIPYRRTHPKYSFTGGDLSQSICQRGGPPDSPARYDKSRNTVVAVGPCPSLLDTEGAQSSGKRIVKC